ncbi:hypothetical protein ACLOJK_007990 [Asimina triloba]
MEMGHLAGTGGLLATCVRVLLAVCGRDGAVAGGDGFGSWKREEDGCRLLDRGGLSSTNGDEVAPWLFARAEGRPNAAGPSSIAVDVDDGDGFWGRKRLDFWMEQMGMMGLWLARGLIVVRLLPSTLLAVDGLPGRWQLLESGKMGDSCWRRWSTIQWYSGRVATIKGKNREDCDGPERPIPQQCGHVSLQIVSKLTPNSPRNGSVSSEDDRAQEGWIVISQILGDARRCEIRVNVEILEGTELAAPSEKVAFGAKQEVLLLKFQEYRAGLHRLTRLPSDYHWKLH